MATAGRQVKPAPQAMPTSQRGAVPRQEPPWVPLATQRLAPAVVTHRTSVAHTFTNSSGSHVAPTGASGTQNERPQPRPASHRGPGQRQAPLSAPSATQRRAPMAEPQEAPTTQTFVARAASQGLPIGTAATQT